MTKSVSTATVSTLDEFVPTTFYTVVPLSGGLLFREPSNDWAATVYGKLDEWSRDPTELADDGLDPPTPQSLRLAVRLAQWLQAAGAECPDRVVPDPSGGIVFRYRGYGWADVFHVWDDGSVERCIFDGSRLVDRSTVNLDAAMPDQWQRRRTF